MTRYRILPYKQGSKSAKSLAEALGGKVLKLIGSNFHAYEDDVIIGWGNTTHSGWSHMLNKPEHILEASNKLMFFNLLKSSNPGIIPKFWTNREEIQDEDYPVLSRTILSGHSGAGIVISSNASELCNAPLYVKYIKKKDEYRVHCGRTKAGELIVISLQRKAKRNGAQNVNWQIRNHANGFVYVRNEINPPASVQDVALQAFGATRLDFGAVDVIWNEQQEKAYVLEINTAPGLEGQTIQDYADFFRGLAG